VFVGSVSLNPRTRASLRIDLAALTAEQTGALPRYRDRWACIRRSTQAADRRAGETGIRLAYEAACLEPPRRIAWCGGPMELADLTAALGRADGANMRPLLVDRVHRRVAWALKRCVDTKLHAAVANAVSIPDALTAAATDAVIRSVRHERRPILLNIRQTASWSMVIRDLFTGSTFKTDAVGTQDLPWLGVYEYFREICDLEAQTRLLHGLWLFAKSAGWMRPHEHTCWVAERHDILCGDARGRLHNAAGPALRYRDGWSVYAWKGVEVPAWIIERPEKITLQAIDDELDLQVPPHMRTAREAVAWTYGMSEDEYAHLTRRT
jgi:hypothetical protein